MRRCVAMAVAGVLAGCTSLTGSDSGYEPDSISLACIDHVSLGSIEPVVIRTQEEYEELIDERFTKPLQDFWDANYPYFLARMEDRYPGLTPEEYQQLAREALYSIPPFWGTEGCEHPSIDFAVYTLLGMGIFGNGCRAPSIDVRYAPPDRDEAASLFVNVNEVGPCDARYGVNVWVLVPRIPEGADVQFASATGHVNWPLLSAARRK